MSSKLTAGTPAKVNRRVASLADLHTTIDDAPGLIQLLLSPAGRASYWQAGAIVCPLEEISPSAFTDLLTLDLARRPDVVLSIGKEDLTGTLADAFEQPNAAWFAVLKSFFDLWSRSAFPPTAHIRPQDLDNDERQALDVLRAAQARLAHLTIAA